jgi:FtsZ-binding cell division protein ZapB
MSDRVIKRLLKHFAELGLTIDLLSNISETDWEMLTDPEGNCLTDYQIEGLKQAVTAYKSKTANKGPSISQKRIDELKEKNDSLERVLTAKTNEDAMRRARISEYASYTRETSAEALRSVQRMVHELSSLGSSLDICFCIDATGSMYGIISSVKKCIVEVAQRITTTTGMVGRFALVVYRDYCDGALRN